MAAQEFKKALGRSIDFTIPEDPKAFIDAANNGKPVIAQAPRSKAARALKQVADKVAAGRQGDDKKALASWRRLLKMG